MLTIINLGKRVPHDWEAHSTPTTIVAYLFDTETLASPERMVYRDNDSGMLFVRYNKDSVWLDNEQSERVETLLRENRT